MYSGSTLTATSGRIMGAHQKIDRVARKKLKELIDNSANFPTTRLILRFEGKNGPDAIKRKSPSEEPHHFIDPFDAKDHLLIDLISEGYNNLVQALKDRDEVKAAFESAWLAHALVDGLTPAHHYPYERELTELRGDSRQSRLTLKKKLIIPGETMPKMIINNWKMWGAKGLMSTHGYFEWGVATVLKPMKFDDIQLEPTDLEKAKAKGLVDYFLEQAKAIAKLKMYDDFYAHGWTMHLARQTRRELLPRIVNTVTLAWYLAAEDSKEKSQP